MNKKPYATDWVKLNDELEYSEQRELYWYKGRAYDERSASHNGLVGAGATLKKMIALESGESKDL